MVGTPRWQRTPQSVSSRLVDGRRWTAAARWPVGPDRATIAPGAGHGGPPRLDRAPSCVTADETCSTTCSGSPRRRRLRSRSSTTSVRPGRAGRARRSWCSAATWPTELERGSACLAGTTSSWSGSTSTTHGVWAVGGRRRGRTRRVPSRRRGVAGRPARRLRGAGRAGRAGRLHGRRPRRRRLVDARRGAGDGRERPGLAHDADRRRPARRRDRPAARRRGRSPARGGRSSRLRAAG